MLVIVSGTAIYVGSFQKALGLGEGSPTLWGHFLWRSGTGNRSDLINLLGGTLGGPSV